MADQSDTSLRAMLAQRMANQGAGGVRNPVNRMLLGLSNPAAEGPAPGVVVQPSAAATGAEPALGLRDRLFRRFISAQQAGFATPGPNIIPGAALRPQVQEAFKDAGGVFGVDVTDLSPEETNALRFMLDPSWVAQHGGQQGA